MATKGICVVPSRYRQMYTEYVNSWGGHVLRLKEIWEDYGHPPNDVDKRMQHVFCWFNERWENIVEDELTNFDNKKNELQRLLSKLSETFENLEISAPDVPAEGSLLERLEWVRGQHAKGEEIVKKRKMRLNELLKDEEEILKMMTDEQSWLQKRNITSKKVDSEVPKMTDLNQLQEHVTNLHKERNRRFEKLWPLIIEARRLLDRMEKMPEQSIEEDIQCLQAEEWKLNCETLDLVDGIVKQLREEENSLSTQHSTLLKRLHQMFDRIDMQKSDQDELLQDIDKRASYQTVNRLESLINNIKPLVEANLSKYIDKLRLRAKELFESLRSGEPWQEPVDLEMVSNQAPSEEMVDLYEKIVEDLNAKYEELAPLFKLVDEFEQLKTKLKELADAQKDPQRFKNRGGALLQETKKYDRVKKQLPVIVAQISKFLDSYEVGHGPVTICGNNLREMIDDQQKNSRSRSNSSLTRSYPSTSQSLKTMTPAASAQKASTLRRADTGVDLRRRIKTVSSVKQRPHVIPVGGSSAQNGDTSNVENESSRSRTTAKKKKNPLRRSLSYDDFESKVSSDQMQSTRLGRGDSISYGSSRRLFF